MPDLILKASTLALIRSKALGEFRDTSRPAGPGLVAVPVAPHTIANLRAIALDGETLEDAIIRACTLHGTKPS